MPLINHSAMTNSAPALSAAKTSSSVSGQDQKLLETAREFEAIFISQMLSLTGFEKALSENAGFGGEAFSQMLIDTYANKLADKGGFGLAIHIYNQLKEDAQ